MAGFRLSLLSEFALSAPGGRAVAITSKKNRALLAILALSPGQSVTRERLAGLLWGDRGEEQARNSLRQSLAVLRKELGPDGSELVRSQDEALKLQLAAAAVDVLDVVANTRSNDVAGLRASAARCSGDLLADLVIHEEGFKEWLAAERTSFGVARLRLFERLAELETGQARVAAAQHLVALDPLRESSQRILIQAYCDVGENALALKQYEKCRDLLSRELNIEPAKETQELRERVGRGGGAIGTSARTAENVSADPLYLNTLASLGQTVRSQVMETSTKDSIAVLPFTNISGEPAQEFFTDGLTEDIITDLSNASGLFVIARNSTLAYKGKPTDVRQIAHDLGVKYILEGSARRSETRLRINVQLSSAAEGGQHVWAERFDRELTDIFAVQDEIARRVVDAICGKLAGIAVFERYRPANLEAYDLCVRSRNQWYISKAANDQSRSLLERAISLDPYYCEAHWQLANALIFSWLVWGDAQEPNHRNALALARRAVEIDPGDSTARCTLGYMLLYDHRWAEAEQEYEAAVRLGPNNAHAFADLAYFHVMNGRPQEAVSAAAHALRLNPRPPGWYFWITGTAQVACGQYENAVATLRREETYRSASRRMLAAALALLGRDKEARAEATLFLATSPHWRIGAWVDAQPFRNAADAEFWMSAFRQAGLPE
ncbi:BTAD domain-containing putative transcriptional regulator [Aestuariivirga sp.]|uniref:BTAD domain-containing putative transcriptional regulator n=1 Tax=Aestuariivirga sp. TaxID=2650926 RepID=UPI00391972F9